MIDWITAVVPCQHIDTIRDGCFQRVKSSGEVEWYSNKRMPVQGSHDARVFIKTHDEGDHSHIEVSGNLVKFFQGHNLWGTDDVPGLVFEFLRWLWLHHGPEKTGLVLPTVDDVQAWRSGDVLLRRVDVTDSFTLGTRSEVLAWLRAAEQTAHLSHRGRGQLTKGSTLYFGKNSRRWALKLYAKGQEVSDNLGDQPALIELPQARAWADNVLRCELVIRSMELQRLGLATVDRWNMAEGVDFEPLELLRERLGTMTMTTTRTLSDEVLSSLTSSQRLAYSAWCNGEDLRALISRPSFYRLRSKLLPHGVDVATVQPKESSNVVPLVRVLEAVPAKVPEWAHGTPLFFEPRKIA